LLQFLNCGFRARRHFLVLITIDGRVRRSQALY
jgi:hypothetical protein